jgi:RNA polymerase sigma-70 factor (ECF subfamily)
VQALWEINNLLLGLPAKAANAFVMAVIQGHSDKDVAQQLGVSDRMVRKYVARVMLECATLDINLNV